MTDQPKEEKVDAVPEVVVDAEAPSELVKLKQIDDVMIVKDDKTGKNMDEEDFDIEKFPVREFRYYAPFLSEPLQFNPVVSLIGVLGLWGLSIWCMVDPEGSNTVLSDMRSNITLNFTWVFILTRCTFFIFIVFVGYRYGHVKLGPQDEPPEFTTGNYFMMIFAAGVAVGLFVYGVAEPLWHRNSHWFANQGYHSQDEVDMYAINLTMNNWGFTAWSPYLVVAVAMALAGHRFKLPMTFRSCFYPILGDYTWGWIGDIIDGFTIITTVAGVCTSLGMGAVQIVDGFEYLNWIDPDASEDKLTQIQNITIWVITAIATASVISGLHAGVQLLSQVAFGLGMLLLFMVLAMDNTKFCLNLIVQEIGVYLQWSVLELNFWTDAFAQLVEGEGRAVDGKAGAVWWMDAWMIFYQAWWVSWSAFVGMFVARISRGRTLGEVISYSMVAPVLYGIIWFSIWGGIGLRQARQAQELEKLGGDIFNDTTHYQVSGNEFCYNVPQKTESFENGTVFFENHLMGVTPVCMFDSSKAGFSAYNVLYSFSFPEQFDVGYGPTLTVIFIFSLAIYFATSSDSGSLIVDHLSANGRMHHHWLQRLFWAVTEGAVATSLLSSGGAEALSAVQAGSIIMGLPFTVMLVYLLESIWVFCEQAAASETAEFVFSNQAQFSMPILGGVFNVMEMILSLGKVNPKRIEKGMDFPTKDQTIQFFKGLCIPFVSLYRVLGAVYPDNRTLNLFAALVYGFCYGAWIWLFCWVSLKPMPGLRAWGWAAFLCCGILLASIRNGFRNKFNIKSNVIADFVASTFLWPQVLTQLVLYCSEKAVLQHEE